jgi:biopolymer transport protein TolR
MGMAAGGSKGGPQSNINMTPMIDILLVLLIIFMVVQQSLQKGVSVQVPPVKKEEATPQTTTPDQIVLEVKAGRKFFLNTEPVPAAGLQARLTEVYAPRPRKVIFVKADEDVTYGDVIYAVDTARASNIEIVGLIPRPDAVVVPGT